MGRIMVEFIAHRVNALAYVTLTRRDDLTVVKIPEHGDLDLLVGLSSPGTRQVRFLGVILHGTPKFLTEHDAERELNAYFRRAHKERASVQYPFPVIALIFSMENDEGFYGWRSQPLLDQGDKPVLKTQQVMPCAKFTKAALDEIVANSNAWYDRLFSLVAPS
jgi:hypothetical protein